MKKWFPQDCFSLLKFLHAAWWLSWLTTHKSVLISDLTKKNILLLSICCRSIVAETQNKTVERFVEVPHYWLYAALKDMVLIVGKLPIKSTQVVPVKSCALGCGLTPMKGHDLITLQL